MTLQKIAKLANVSVSTVSRALNNSFDINPETRELVLKIADEQGYFREKKRVKMENKRKNSINVAIICPEIISSHYSDLVTALAEVIRQKGSDCTVYYNDFSEEKLRDIIKRSIEDSSHDSIICFNDIPFDAENGNIPIVCQKGLEKYSKLVIDYSVVLKQCVEHLIKAGKKKIAYAGESHTAHKELHLKNALNEKGLSLFASYKSNKRFGKAGEECAFDFLEDDVRPDAVVCAYDEIAFGFIHTLNKKGIKIPKDVAVMGINNVPSSEYFFNGLTTIGYDCKSVFSLLVDDLSKEVQKNTFTPKTYNIPTILVDRSTV